MTAADGQGTRKYQPKHRQVYQSLRDDIVQGRLAPGALLPNDAVIGQRFNVSRGTVLRALEALQNEGVIERIQGRGTFVSGPLTRNSRDVKWRVMLLTDQHWSEGLTDTIFTGVAHEAATVLRQEHGSLLVQAPAGLPGEPAAARAALIAHALQERVDGVIYLPPEEARATAQLHLDLLKPLIERDVKIVLLDRDITPQVSRSGYDLISTDNWAAGGEVGRHMIERGCRRLLFVAPLGEVTTIIERVRGVRDAIEAADPKIKMKVSPVARVDPPHADDAPIEAEVRRYKPDGIIAKDDRTAVAVLRVLYQNHLRVPDEVPVISFDDAPIAAAASVPLTTYRQPARALARVAVRRLAERLGGCRLPPQITLIQGELVRRASA